MASRGVRAFHDGPARLWHSVSDDDGELKLKRGMTIQWATRRMRFKPIFEMQVATGRTGCEVTAGGRSDAAQHVPLRSTER